MATRPRHRYPILALALVVSVPQAAVAQPAPPPPPRATAPPDLDADCILRRREIGAKASATTDAKARQQLLLGMPDCTRGEFAGPTPTTEGDITESSTATSEINVGLGIFSFGGSSITRVGGLNLAAGGFVSRRVALSARLAGGTVFGSGFVGYLGVAGPHVQVWLDDHFWLGGGGGLGFLVAAGSGGAGAAHGSGLDFRAGYSLASRGSSTNFSVEATSFSDGSSFAAPFSDNGLTVLSFLVGYQAGGPRHLTAKSHPGRPTRDDRTAELIRAAHDAAVVGDCAKVKTLAPEVRARDASLYAVAFEGDETIARCLAPPPPPPAAVTPPPPTPPTQEPPAETPAPPDGGMPAPPP